MICTKIIPNIDNISRIGFLVVFLNMEDYLIATNDIVMFIVTQHGPPMRKVGTLGFPHLPN